jgi:hypothetical protein
MLAGLGLAGALAGGILLPIGANANDSGMTTVGTVSLELGAVALLVGILMLGNGGTQFDILQDFVQPTVPVVPTTTHARPPDRTFFARPRSERVTYPGELRGQSTGTEQPTSSGRSSPSRTAVRRLRLGQEPNGRDRAKLGGVEHQRIA